MNSRQVFLEYQRLAAELANAERAVELAQAWQAACEARIQALQAACPHTPTEPYRDECPYCFRSES